MFGAERVSIELEHYLVLSATLFVIGLFGTMAKRNFVVILMSIELMLNGVNVAMVAFSRYVVPDQFTGHIFAILSSRSRLRKSQSVSGSSSRYSIGEESWMRLK